VDSLLGIGKMGGKIGDDTSKNSEAAVLADRLKEMRKSRDERSKVLIKESSMSSVPNNMNRNLSPANLQASSTNTGIKSPPTKKKKKTSKGK